MAFIFILRNPLTKTFYICKDIYIIDIPTGGCCQQVHVKEATASWSFC